MPVMMPWLLVALAVLAQAAPNKAVETKHLMLTTSASAGAVAPGKKASLWIDVEPRPTMHVYSPGQKGYIAITLTLEENAAVTAAKAKYPPGEKFFMEALNETQLVYAKPFRIAQDVTLKPGGSAESVVIKGSVRYQACDDKICYLPQTVPVQWTIRRATPQ